MQRRQPLAQILLAQGVKFGRVVQEITAEVAEPARARLLNLETGAPLLKFVRLLHDLNRQPAATRNSYAIQTSADQFRAIKISSRISSAVFS